MAQNPTSKFNDLFTKPLTVRAWSAVGIAFVATTVLENVFPAMNGVVGGVVVGVVVFAIWYLVSPVKR